MYENAQAELDRILKLVETCPQPLQAKAFEILLTGYVNGLRARPEQRKEPPPPPPARDDSLAAVPAEVLPRLGAMAKRLGVSADQLVALFDFSLDPFTFVPIHIPGAAKNERTKKVALAVAGRSFLASGNWLADWAEIKAMCTYQSCYDSPNFSTTLKSGKGTVFSKIDVGKGVELSAEGQKEAESLLAELAGSDATT